MDLCGAVPQVPYELVLLGGEGQVSLRALPSPPEFFVAHSSVAPVTPRSSRIRLSARSTVISSRWWSEREWVNS